MMIPSAQNTARTLSLRVVDRREIVCFEDVVWFKSNRNYTLVILSDGRKILSSKTLGVYEKIMPSGFLRAHRSCIINCAYIKHVNRATRVCILTNGQELEISQRRIRQFIPKKTH